MQSAFILIVEDERPIALLLKTLVDKMGHEAVIAADGAAAIVEATKRKPDLILLDLILPIMSGWEFLKAMPGDPNLRDVPVVLVTTVERMDQELQEKYPVVPKPFSPETVRQAVETALGA